MANKYSGICRGVVVYRLILQVDRLVQERRNSIANALELRLSCTNLSKRRLPMYFGITQLRLGQSYAYSIASEATLVNMGQYITWIK